jgi:hypothetical protein
MKSMTSSIILAGSAGLALLLAPGLPLAQTVAQTQGEAEVETAPAQTAQSDASEAMAAQNTPAPVDPIEAATAIGDFAGLAVLDAGLAGVLLFRDAETGDVIVGRPFDGQGRSLLPQDAFRQELNLTAYLDAIQAAAQPKEPQGFTAEQAFEQAPALTAFMALLPEEERKKAVTALIEALKPVKTEADFQAAIQLWLEEIGLTEPGKALGLVDAIETGQSLFVGRKNVPVVTIVFDPADPEAVERLRPLVDPIWDGRLAAKFHFAPVTSEDSAAISAGLLLDEPSDSALLTHIEEFGKETYSPETGLVSDLPEDVIEGLRQNGLTVRSYEVPELPLFIFEKDGIVSYTLST